MASFPRYTPDLDLKAWLRALLSLESPLELRPLPHRIPFDSARSALIHYFQDLRGRTEAGRVLLSAQICPVVPRLVSHCGFEPCFVDLDQVHPCPGPEQFRPGLCPQVAALVVSPFYGHLPPQWEDDPCNDFSGELVLDFAQGLSLDFPRLMKRADAVVYSFGLGKGLDTGGGLLATRRYLSPPPAKSLAGPAVTLVKAGLLLALQRIGLYQLLLPYLEQTEDLALRRPHSLPESALRLWEHRLPSLIQHHQRARQRAARLIKVPRLVELCKDLDVYGGSSPNHLRQVLRLQRAEERDLFMQNLRCAGIDCAPAGEPLPDSVGDFPRARAFRTDSLRLPFMGRFSESRFGRLLERLEACVADCLSKRI